MRKEHVKVKESLSETDKINMTHFLFEGYFLSNGEGEILYTPYFREINRRTAFFLYAVTGLIFEEEKKPDGTVLTDEAGNAVIESVYDCSVADEELSGLYQEVCSSNDPAYAEIALQLGQIEEDVRDMVDFKKQQIIHRSKDTLSELLAAVTDKVKGLDISALNLEEVIRSLQKPLQKM